MQSSEIIQNNFPRYTWKYIFGEIKFHLNQV